MIDIVRIIEFKRHIQTNILLYLILYLCIGTYMDKYKSHLNAFLNFNLNFIADDYRSLVFAILFLFKLVGQNVL